MTFHVRILPRAMEDIERNARWWAEHHSVEEGVRWFFAMHDQLHTLKDFPQSNPLSAENGEFPYEIRDKLLGLGSRPTYRAIFTIKGDEVHVLTVRSAAQDIVTPQELDD